MIPLIDLAVIQRVKSIFPVTKSAWFPSKDGRKSAYVTLNMNAGESGITMFRNNIADHEKGTNLPWAAGDGGQRYTTNQDKTESGMQNRFPVTVEYEVSFWTYSQSALNEINRTVVFSPIYEPLLVQYGNNEYRFSLQYKDPNYNFEGDDDLESIRYYNMVYTFNVDAFWLREYNVKLANTALINYYDDITSGKLIDTLSIIPRL